MRRLIACSLIALGLPTPAPAEEVLRDFSWVKLQAAGQLPDLKVEAGQSPSPTEQLTIDNPAASPKTVTVLRVASPGISRPRYALTGQVRYEGVEGQGYLEMWSCFPDGGEFFSRTLSGRGAMKHLEGSSDWRPFVLPYLNDGNSQQPCELVVNVVLPGRGTVDLGPPRLIQYAGDEDPTRLPDQWWGERTAGLYGGMGGTVIGCLGGLVGTLAGLGKARRLVLGLMTAVLVLGLLLLVVAVVAISQSQPFWVFYPPLLAGLLCAGLMGGLLPRTRRQYAERELRKIAAADAAVFRQ